MSPLFDTHCHIDAKEFDADRAQVIAEARAVGVTHMLVPGVLADGWDALQSLCASEPGLYPAYGLHPVYCDRHRLADLDRLARQLESGAPVAVGEIGLDFQIPAADRDAQMRLFEAQLAMARDAGLPVVLHVRKAHDAVLDCLRRIRVPGGFAHAFNGSVQQAAIYESLGFRLGFGGMLTYVRSTRLRRLARELPLDLLVLETDAPDLTVASHHGERNSPAYLPECLAALAEVKDEDPAEVARITTANACAVLGLDCPGD